MNNSLEVLKSIYKPLKYTIRGKTTILKTTSGDFVVKERHNDVRSLFNYLKSRNFYNFPKLIDDSRKDLNVYEMIEDVSMPQEQKMDDLIDLVSMLHNKTSYYKEVTEDKYQEIYENVKSNIEYLRNIYNNYYDVYLPQKYLSPSQYTLMRNISKIFLALDFCDNEVNKWFDLVRDEKKQRVSVVHNNLEASHLIRNNDNYLISWDYAKVDTPIIDIVKLYKNEYFNYDFSPLLEKYFLRYPLNEAEKKLFFILIALPPEIKMLENEYQNTKQIREKLDYVFKTEELLRPYYSKNQEEE
ncbi:MAG: hypothetical protein IJO33_05215 [Bacilli bacterium]|nr:hypothetical protein [Bacilli bacterium]